MSEFLSRLGGAALNDMKGTPLDKILNHLMGGRQGASGLESLVERIRDGGLREQVESWISTGTNRPVAPQDMERALGEGEADRLAHEAGMEKPGLLAVLSQVLPRLIDGVTPQGRLPTQGEMPEGSLTGMLRQVLGHLGGEQGAAAGQAGTPAAAEEAPRNFGESPSAAPPRGSGPDRTA